MNELSDASVDLLVSRSDLKRADLRRGPARPALAPGEARLGVRRVALTSNNVTYGAFGDMLGYWKFFPAPEGYGRIQVWGFAEVVESRSDALVKGERVFGYLPMSDALTIAPGRASAYCVYDGAAHRAALLPFYNRYVRVAADPLYEEAAEPAQAVLQVLFATSFLLFEQMRATGFSGARQVTITSASSKTAAGLALLLKEAGIETAGITSERNAGFCRSLGIYDRLVPYESLEMLPKSATAIVDFAGDAAVRGRLHRHFGEGTVASVLVGGTHGAASGEAGAMPGATPTLFFVPTVYDARLADIGPDAWAAQFAPHWQRFRSRATSWFRTREAEGFEALLAAYASLAAGRVDPAEGLSFRL